MISIQRNTFWAIGLCVGLLLAAGCQTKRLSIVSEPAGAEVEVTRLRDGVREESHRPGVTPCTVTLNFDKGVSYEIRADKRQYHSAKAHVEFEPRDQNQVRLKLEQYLQTVNSTAFRFQRTGERARLLPVRIETEGYLDTREPDNPNATDFHMLESDKAQLEDLAWVSASKSEDDRVVFQVVCSYTPEEYIVPEEQTDLLHIAAEYELSLADLRAMNGLPRTQLKTEKGQRLKISEPSALTQIYHRQAQGPGVIEVTNGKSTDLFPCFDWKGDEVIMTSNLFSNDPQSYTLHRARMDTPNVDKSQIVPSNVQSYAPSAGYNQWVYFTAIAPRSVFPQINYLRLKEKEVSQLLDNGEFPQVSLEGEVIFLRRISEHNDNRQIYRMSGNGANLTRLTANEDYDISSAAWSPDGKWIVFAANGDKNADGIANYSLYLMDRSARRTIRLTTNGSWDDCPSWNHAGLEIFFRSNRGGHWRIWRLKPVLPPIDE